MSSSNKVSATPGDARLRSERGAILFIVAACLVVLLGFMGLAIDLGHAYTNKSQLQSMADACSLAGATALNGTSDGIQAAVDRARDSLSRLSNKKEFNTTTVALAEGDVSFSATLNNPTYLNKTQAQAVANTILYVKVVIPTQTSEVVFAKLIPGIPNVLNVSAEAVAGQQSQTKVCSGVGPFSPSRRDIQPFCTTDCSGTDPNFGFQIGLYYTLRQPGTGNGNNTADSCADREINSTTGNFGLADPSACGTNTPCYRDTVVNGSTGNCVEIADNELPTITGNKGINVQRGLQDRFANDCVQYGAGQQDSPMPFSDYLAATVLLEASLTPPTDCALWRRVIPVPVNDGFIPNGQGNYNVDGFACFYMPFPPSAQPPSSNICLQFVGACDPNGRPPGTVTAPSITRLVLFR